MGYMILANVTALVAHMGKCCAASSRRHARRHRGEIGSSGRQCQDQVSHLLRRPDLVPGSDARLRLLRRQPVSLLRSLPAGLLRRLCGRAGRELSIAGRGRRPHTRLPLVHARASCALLHHHHAIVSTECLTAAATVVNIGSAKQEGQVSAGKYDGQSASAERSRGQTANSNMMAVQRRRWLPHCGSRVAM